MFTRKEVLIKKTGPDGVGRYDFLKQLVTEFHTTTTSKGNLHNLNHPIILHFLLEAKRQVLANLANFAYDPINFEFLKQLYVIDLFLAQLSERDEDLIRFAIGGLCNISPGLCISRTTLQIIH